MMQNGSGEFGGLLDPVQRNQEPIHLGDRLLIELVVMSAFVEKAMPLSLEVIRFAAIPKIFHGRIEFLDRRQRH